VQTVSDDPEQCADSKCTRSHTWQATQTVSVRGVQACATNSFEEQDEHGLQIVSVLVPQACA